MKMMTVGLMDDSGNDDSNDTVNGDVSIPVFDNNLIKIVIVKKSSKITYYTIWLFWTYLSFAIFAAILHD